LVPEASTQPDGLVVIPCLNEEDHIASVVGIALRDALAHRLLIVVVDGGSVDGTRGIVSRLAAEAPNVKIVDNPARIQSAGINLAVQLFGQGRRWLIRMDAHAEYPQGYISQLVAEAERTRATSVVVSMKAQGRGCFQRAVAVAQNSVIGAGGSAHRREGLEGFVDHGHHALFDMERFQALNGYNEAQSHNEDAEFDVRLSRAGGQIWLTRATNVTYFPRARAKDLYNQYRNYGRGRALTIMRHRTRPKLRQMLPVAVAPSVLALLATPWLPWAALPALLWLAACMAFGPLLAWRDRSRCALAAGYAASIMHLAWSVGFWWAWLEAARPMFKRSPAAAG